MYGPFTSSAPRRASVLNDFRAYVTTLEPAWLSLAPHARECFRLYAGNLWEKDVYKLAQKGPIIRLGKP